MQGVFQKLHAICWTKSLTSPNCIPTVNTLSQLRLSYPNYKSEKLNLLLTVRWDCNAIILLSSKRLCYDLFLYIISVTEQCTISSLVICLLTPFNKIYIHFHTNRPTSHITTDQHTSIVNKVVSKRIGVLQQQHRKKENRLKETTRSSIHIHKHDGLDIYH